MKGRRLLLIPLVGCLGLCAILCGCGMGVARMTFPVTRMEGQSMAPTLKTGDLTRVNLWAYRRHPPMRGDLIVLKHPAGELLLKRVIGLPGEQVDIIDGKVFIDGAQSGPI